MLSKLRLQPLSITKCRAFCKDYCSFIGFLLFFFSYSVHCATEQQIEAIKKAAENYVMTTIEPPNEGTITAQAANLDNRIQATDCPTGLSAFSSSRNSSASNITVLVQCEAENWRTYVPVRLNITVTAVVANIALVRGQILSAQDVRLNMVDLLRFRQQGFSSTEYVVGAKTKRNIPMGRIITQNDICLVCRRENVIIKAVKNDMTITTKGIALSDGSLGEQIKVKNEKSQRIISATVTGITEVTVQF
jgi:flagellar basal body P-ring formation protein FlgA